MQSVSPPCEDVLQLDVVHPALFALRVKPRSRVKDKLRALVKGFLGRP